MLTVALTCKDTTGPENRSHSSRRLLTLRRCRRWLVRRRVRVRGRQPLAERRMARQQTVGGRVGPNDDQVWLTLCTGQAGEEVIQGAKGHKVGRDAGSGKLIPVKTAQRWPKTAVVETIKNSGK